MLFCWNEDPKERLAFSDMVEAIESILMEVTKYLDFNELLQAVDECDNSDEDGWYQEMSFPLAHQLNPSKIILCQELFI